MDGKLFIRANQGHTLQIDESKLLNEIKGFYFLKSLMEKTINIPHHLDPSLYPLVCHGTYKKAWALIKPKGLS